MESKTSCSLDSYKLRKVLFWLMLGCFLEIMCIIGGTKPNLLSLLFFTLFMGCISYVGELILRIWGGTFENNAGITLIIGIATLSIPMVLLALLFPINALESFIIAFLGSVIFCTRKQKPFQPLNYPLKESLFLFILMLIVIIASYRTSGSIVALMNGQELHAWSDYYIHGITINSFTNNFLIGHGDPYLVDTSKRFYHYASFVIAGATIPISGLSALATSTSILLPLGLLVGIWGLYALALELGGRLVAAVSIALLIGLPEPAVYTKAGFFDFYWLLFTAPGSGYAIGITSAALVLLNRYLNSGIQASLFLSSVLLFSLIFMRAHFFIAIAPAVFYLLILHWFPNLKKYILVVSLIIVIVLTGLLTLNSLINQLWIQYSQPVEFLSATIVSPYYAKLLTIMPFATIKLLLALISVLGIFIIIFPTLFLIERLVIKPSLKNNLQLWLPWLLIINLIGLILFAPRAVNGDLTEYKHRAFVLFYPLIIIFSTLSGKEILTYFRVNVLRKEVYVEYALLMLALTAAIFWVSLRNPAEPMYESLPWAREYFDRSISKGVHEVAKFINARSKVGEKLAFNIEASKSPLNNPAIETLSLTGMPAYVARMAHPVRSLAGKKIIAYRLKILTDLEDQKTWQQAYSLMNANGIRWYIYFNYAYPNFDPQGECAALHVEGATVYDFIENMNAKNTNIF